MRKTAAKRKPAKPKARTAIRSSRETERIVQRADFLRDLLREFGVVLGGFDPGVLAHQRTGTMNYRGEEHTVTLDFGRAQWAWLEPLLVELRDRRKA